MTDTESQAVYSRSSRSNRMLKEERVGRGGVEKVDGSITVIEGGDKWNKRLEQEDGGVLMVLGL